MDLPTLSAERQRFALWIPVLLGVGIGVYFVLPKEPAWWLAPQLCISLITALYLGRNIRGLKWLALAGVIVSVGFLASYQRTQALSAPMLHKTLYSRTIEGRVAGIQVREDGLKLLLTEVSIERVKPRTTPQRITVSYKKPLPGLEVGMKVRMKAILFPPPTPVMPGAFDFARTYYFERIGAVGYTPDEPEIIEAAPPSGFRPWLNHLRMSIADRISAAMSEEGGAVAIALMVGEMSRVSEEVKDAMRDSGIYHVLSISGLHMSLAAGLIYAATRLLLLLHMGWAQRLPVKKIAAVAGLLGAFVYLLLAGYPVPAVRSFVMVACVMIAVIFDRRGISMYSLCWAACFILLLWPESLLGASFQLSFAATLAVVALYERYGHLLTRSGDGMFIRLKYYFIGLMISSLAATLATTPLVIYHFNRVTLWGIAANMLLLPLTSFWIMTAAVLAFIAMPFGLEAFPLKILDIGIGVMIGGAKWLADLPYAAFPLPSPAFWGLLLAVFGGVWLCLWQKRWRLWGLPLILIGTATLLLHKPYDLMISDDASSVMVRADNGQYVFLKGKPGGFDGRVWLASAGEETGLLAKEASYLVACDTLQCRMNLNGKTLAMGKSKDAVASVCQPSVDIAVFKERVKNCNVPLLIDGNFLERSGAVGVRLHEGQVDVDTSMERRGRRRWVSLPYSMLYPKRDTDMIPATSEEKVQE